ncbi:MAG: hypothetical protein M3Q69_17780 [Acidobacteriota bacterium]|nr:hypothetical protein [Acidobacteriota bacterium]
MRICLVMLLLVAACNGDPTSPALCADAIDLFRTEAFYVERTEAETTIEGRLVKNCPPPSPNGRDHCYFVGDLPVYAGDRAAVLDRYVGSQVVVRGKRVTLLGTPEFWPAAICRRP